MCLSQDHLAEERDILVSVTDDENAVDPDTVEGTLIPAMHIVEGRSEQTVYSRYSVASLDDDTLDTDADPYLWGEDSLSGFEQWPGNTQHVSASTATRTPDEEDRDVAYWAIHSSSSARVSYTLRYLDAPDVTGSVTIPVNGGARAGGVSFVLGIGLAANGTRATSNIWHRGGGSDLFQISFSASVTIYAIRSRVGSVTSTYTLDRQDATTRYGNRTLPVTPRIINLAEAQQWIRVASSRWGYAYRWVTVETTPQSVQQFLALARMTVGDQIRLRTGATSGIYLPDKRMTVLRCESWIDEAQVIHFRHDALDHDAYRNLNAINVALGDPTDGIPMDSQDYPYQLAFGHWSTVTQADQIVRVYTWQAGDDGWEEPLYAVTLNRDDTTRASHVWIQPFTGGSVDFRHGSTQDLIRTDGTADTYSSTMTWAGTAGRGEYNATFTLIHDSPATFGAAFRNLWFYPRVVRYLPPPPLPVYRNAEWIDDEARLLKIAVFSADGPGTSLNAYVIPPTGLRIVVATVNSDSALTVPFDSTDPGWYPLTTSVDWDWTRSYMVTTDGRLWHHNVQQRHITHQSRRLTLNLQLSATGTADTGYEIRMTVQNLNAITTRPPYTLYIRSLYLYGIRHATPAPDAGTPAAPTVPQFFEAGYRTGSVRLTWLAPGTTTLFYRLDRRQGTSGNWNVRIPQWYYTSWSEPSPGDGTWQYRVRAVNGVGAGQWTLPATIEIPGVTTPVRNLRYEIRGGTDVVLLWDPPLSDGGSDILYYRIRDLLHSNYPYPQTVSTSWTDSRPWPTHDTTFRVWARTEAGLGQSADLVVRGSATVLTVPSAPTNLTVTYTATDLTLTWEAPASDGGANIVGYTVERRRGSGSWVEQTTAATGLSYTQTRPSVGSTWQYRVAARNAEGTGTWSNVATANLFVPRAPTNISASSSGLTVTLTWTAPDESGRPATLHYEIDCSANSGATWDLQDDTDIATTWSQAHSASGTYRYRVRAVNDVGTGPWSSQVDVVVTAPVPATPPTVPIQVTAWYAPVSDTVTVAWSAPRSDGGSPITSYSVFRGGTRVAQNISPTGTRQWSQPAPSTGTYGYTVSAHNAEGESTRPGAINVQIEANPIATPPRNLTITQTATHVVLTWTPPVHTNGTIDFWHIRRRTAVSNHTRLTNTLAVNITTYRDAKSGLSTGPYWYQIRAQGDDGWGRWSQEVMVTVT